MPACTQCRQRKVRCSGGADSCEACTRLGFACSLSSSPSPVTSLEQRAPSVPRARGGRACDQCHAHRVRCVRNRKDSCIRCQRQGHACVQSLSVRRFRVQQHQQRLLDANTSVDLTRSYGNNESTLSPSIGTATPSAASKPEPIDRVLECEKTLVRSHINAFFEFIYPIPGYSFLHRAEILRQYSSGDMPSVLLLAMCGAVSRFISMSENAVKRSKSWIEAAESKVLRSLGETKLYYAEALIILGFNRRCNHQSGKTFFFVSLAARMAYHLKLHRENHVIPFMEQERRRRLVWCIFAVDRFCAGGVSEYLVMSTASLNVQLPCHDRFFDTDSAVKTCFLLAKEQPASALSLFALMMRLFDIRNRVLQYAKVHLESSISPDLTLTQFKGFEEEFQGILASLSPEQQFSAHAFELRAFSPDRTSFIMFHVYFHHCQCELYRLLNPGYREALQEHVIDSTSPELVVYAQTQCLKHAIAIGEIIATTHQLVGDELYISDAAIFVMLYQASCAILYACHRDSPAFAMSPATAQRYFAVFIETLVRLLRYFPRFIIYVEDIRNMLRSVADPYAPLPRQKAAVEVDFRARPIPGEERSDSDESTAAADRDNAAASPAAPHLGQIMASNTVDLAPSSSQSVHRPDGDDALFWPYLGTANYDLDLISDPSHGLLWDWADALGPGLPR